jgi:hypothetical protein
MNFMHADIKPRKPLPDVFQGMDCKGDIRELLEKSEQTLEKEGVLDQMIKLEDWIDSYNKSQPAAYRLKNDGIACLKEMRERLTKKADDLIRLEGEGGPSPPAQEQEIDELNNAIKRIDHMIAMISGKPQEGLA